MCSSLSPQPMGVKPSESLLLSIIPSLLIFRPESPSVPRPLELNWAERSAPAVFLRRRGATCDPGSGVRALGSPTPPGLPSSGGAFCSSSSLRSTVCFISPVCLEPRFPCWILFKIKAIFPKFPRIEEREAIILVQYRSVTNHSEEGDSVSQF